MNKEQLRKFSKRAVGPTIAGLAALSVAGCNFPWSKDTTNITIITKMEATATRMPEPTATTTRPTETAAVEPTKIATAKAEKITQATHLNPGQSFDAQAGSFIAGDVKVDGKPEYDNLADTGLIVIMDQKGKVSAEWGANMIFPDPSKLEAEIIRVTTEMKDNGCVDGKGCKDVKVLRYPTDKPQGQ